jgi:hypothetical protein
MTPPHTGARTPSVERDMPPPSMRPLAAAAAARKAQQGSGSSSSSDPQPRPLRGFSSKPRALGARRELVIEQDGPLGGEYVTSPTSPQTPTQKRTQAVSLHDESNDDLTGDVDDDASPLSQKEDRRLMAGERENIGSES